MAYYRLLSIGISPSGNGNLGGPIASVPYSSFTLFGPVFHPIPDRGFTEYRCLYFKNKEPNLTVPIEIFGDCDNDFCRLHTQLAVGLGVSPINGIEPAIPDPYTEPLGVDFVSATDLEPLVIGPLGPEEHKAVWFKRTVLSSCPFEDLYVNFTFRYPIYS